MMILGLVSFVTFIFFEGSNVSKDSEWYYSFEFAHFIVLFIALAIVIQALLLTKFITIQRKRLYSLFYISDHLLISKFELLKRYYKNTIKPNYMRFMYNLFHNAPLAFPYPALRDAMEYKIIEEQFIRTFYLPEQFHFAEYMSTRFQSHIFGLIEVHPITWFVVIIMVALNYGRIKLIDPSIQHKVCEEFKKNEFIETYDDHHRFLSSTEIPSCDQYILRVCFIYAVFLSLFIFSVYLVSNFYFSRHLNNAVKDIVEPVQFRCEQHIPFKPERDDDAEYKKTGSIRSLYGVNYIILN